MAKLSSNQSIKELIANKQFHIKKHFGQNFLTDDNILRKIVAQAHIQPTDGVIEIGPGLGALTTHLLQTNAKLLAYEIDTDLIPLLKQEFGQNKGFTLLHKDILEADIDQDIKEHLKDSLDIVVVANLPYYITTPILMRFLETSRRVNRLVVMMQQEVALRLTSKPSTKDYNAFSIIVQYLTKASYAFKVPRTVFIPQPNVDSAIVVLEVRQDRLLPEPLEKPFFDFVHRCFQQRRKTLVNNLIQGSKAMTRIEIETLLLQQAIPLTVRSEQLTIEPFIQLFKAIHSFQ